VGNVKDKPFSEIWTSDDELMVKLREKHKYLQGKCGTCDFKSLCSGCRIRARAAYGNIWAEDPACYLNVEEIVK
jgi:radical SAM protein with 4Fe4S-binding SPASM domain